MRETFIFFRSTISGGTATLSIRIGKWFITQGYRVVYLCFNNNDVNNYKLMRELGIKVYVWNNEQFIKEIVKKYASSHIYILTYTLEEYLYIDNLVKSVLCKYTSSIFLYVVSPNGLARKRQHIYSRIMDKLMGNMIGKLIKNGTILFMDTQTKTLTINYYRLNKCKAYAKIFNLPFEVTKLNCDLLKKKVEKDKLNILAMARAEFPFKGYLIGLVDEFEKCYKKNENLSMTIISFGDDFEMLELKVNQKNYGIMKRIQLIGNTAYGELKVYFEKAHLFLGMGTSIIDAVNHGVPSIVVKPYTYECRTNGYFHETDGELGCFEDEAIFAGQKILQACELNKTDYIKLCIEEHRCLKEKYCIDLLPEYFIDAKLNTSFRITCLEYALYSLFVSTIRIFRKYVGT